MPLNAKQARFVAEYLKDLKAGPAAIRAGYSAKTAETCGPRLLRNAQIRSEVDKATAKVCARAEVSAEYILSSLLNVAERCQQAVPVYEKRDGELVETGEYKFDSGGANKALELLGKHLALFTDKLGTFRRGRVHPHQPLREATGLSRPPIDLGFEPRPHQFEAHERRKRFSVLVWHRRSGKTVYAIIELLLAALTAKRPRSRFGYVAPFYRQAKQVAWAYLTHYARLVPGVTSSRPSSASSCRTAPRSGSSARTTRTRSAACTSTASSSTRWPT